MMIKVYIKLCDICGLQYFGQTIQNICEQSIKYPNDSGYYEGSGREWVKHNKFHKTHKTKILFDSNDRLEIQEYCKEFSKVNPNYWETSLFANMIEEDGVTSIGQLNSHPRWDRGKSYNELPNLLEQKLLEIKPEYLEKTITWSSKSGPIRTKKIVVENTDRQTKILSDIEMYINRAEKRMLVGKDDISLTRGYIEYGPKNLMLIEKMLDKF